MAESREKLRRAEARAGELEAQLRGLRQEQGQHRQQLQGLRQQLDEANARMANLGARWVAPRLGGPKDWGGPKTGRPQRLGDPKACVTPKRCPAPSSAPPKPLPAPAGGPGSSPTQNFRLTAAEGTRKKDLERLKASEERGRALVRAPGAPGAPGVGSGGLGAGRWALTLSPRRRAEFRRWSGTTASCALPSPSCGATRAGRDSGPRGHRAGTRAVRTPRPPACDPRRRPQKLPDPNPRGIPVPKE